MTPLIKILAAGIPAAAIILSFLLFFICRCRRRSPQHLIATRAAAATSPPTNDDVLQSAIDKFHNRSTTAKHSLRFHQLRDTTRLNAWTQFVFAADISSSSHRSSPLWTLCARPQQESPRAAAEILQTVRINPLRSKTTRMSLPLPGPSTSFPQEAYFEITIIGLRLQNSKKRAKDGAVGDGAEDDLTKLKSSLEEEKFDDCLICLGLSRGVGAEAKLIPGTYPGSIGFQSDGSIRLDGMKLVSESERTVWAGIDRVIGCGFNPSKKNVFFTVDSELVHVIRCHSDAYKSPLYPVLAASSEVTVTVNLGQAPFKYATANKNRIANPRFASLSPGSSSRSDDSREFFSMEIPDTEPLDYAAGKKGSKKSVTKSRHNNWDQDSATTMDIDKDSDLFEIALNY